jgi:hypothetical protein
MMLVVAPSICTPARASSHSQPEERWSRSARRVEEVKVGGLARALLDA